MGGLPDQAAHCRERAQERLVHRDVSSGNVLLAADGGARLADFGLAQALHAPDAVLPGAEPGRADSVLIGTYGYATPEYMSIGARALTLLRVFRVMFNGYLTQAEGPVLSSQPSSGS